jgi:hypothetical protein
MTGRRNAYKLARSSCVTLSKFLKLLVFLSPVRWDDNDNSLIVTNYTVTSIK